MKKVFIFLIFYLILNTSLAQAKVYSIYCFLDEVKIEDFKLNKNRNEFSNYDIWEFEVNKDLGELRIKYGTSFLLPERVYPLKDEEYIISGFYVDLKSMNKQIGISNTTMDNLTISKVKGIAQYQLHYKDYTKTYYLSNCSNKKPKLLF